MADDQDKIDDQSDKKKPFFSASSDDLTYSYDSSGEVLGSQIGPYKLLSVLGEGGYGIVYLAEQHKPIRRRVALKIIKPGMDTRQVIARFEAERQALALFDHPNIAHVYEAGATKTGRPYFVMEHVKGMPVTEHCDQEKSGIEERLKLFLDICDAIQYAHQKGIIHRDIKPSNILVSIDSKGAVPKVIDFGVAKATSQPLTERTLYTEQGQLIGTPEYMSPEQAEMTTQDIDTRSDVYSLGVLLYELLTGVLPFDSETLREAGIDRLRQIIREEEPKTPSTHLSHMGEQAVQIATNRRTEPGTLSHRLHKELEWIPMKAMRKERERRYQSISELADDIQNYLNGNPLIAGPESAMYKARKFVRRHSGTVAAATAIVVLLIVGFTVSTALYVQAEQARKIAYERAESLRRSNYGNSIELAQSARRDGRAKQATRLLTQCPMDLRGWEWDWLSYITDESEITLGGWPEYKGLKEITSIVLSPDGKRVFAAGVKSGIQAWNLESGADDVAFWVGDWVESVAIDPTGSKLVTGTRGGAIQLWDVNTGEQLMTLQKGKKPYSWDLTEIGCSVTWSSNGRRIASGGKTIQVWDSITGERLMILRGHTDKVRDVAFSPDSKRIVSGSVDKTVKIWDASTGEELMTLAGHTGEVYSVAFSRNSKKIVSGSGTIKIWNAKTGENLLTIYGGKDNTFLSVMFSPDGQQIVSGGLDSSVILWDATNGAEITSLRGHDQSVTSVAFSPDGKRVISGSYDQFVKVWNPSVNRERTILYGHKTRVKSVSFSPDGRSIVSSGYDGTIKIWDVDSACEKVTLYGHRDTIHCVSFSPDGERIASASTDADVKIWSAITGDEVMTLSGHADIVNCVSFSPDGKRIVSGSDDKSIKVYDAATGRELRTLTGHQDGVSSIGFRSSGDLMASTSWDGYAKIWDGVSGEEIASFQVHELTANCLVFTPDGRHIVTGIGYRSGNKRGHEANIWDVYSNERVMTLDGAHRNVTSVACTPDCRRILTAIGVVVKLWDADSGAGILEVHTNGYEVHSLAISPDGKRIATGNDNGDIVLLESAAPAAGYTPRINAESARKIVEWLHKECGSYKEVLEKLEADTSLDESIRKFGLQIARSRLGEDSRKLAE